METRTIGPLKVSVIGLGCNNFGRRLDEKGAAAVIDAALDAGINFFDTADVYGNGQSEEYLSKALGSRRRDVIIATKFGKEMSDGSKGRKRGLCSHGCRGEFAPPGDGRYRFVPTSRPGIDAPFEETLGALDDLVKEGKIREIGCSNFNAEQIRHANDVVKPGAARYVSVQNEYSLLKRDPEHGVLAECERLGLAFLPYFPLAAGLLTGKYRKDQPLPAGTRITGGPAQSRWVTDHNLILVEALIKFAEGHGHSLLELAFAWLLARPVVASVIAGAMTPEQVHANAAITWRLTDADMAQIDAILAQAEQG